MAEMVPYVHVTAGIVDHPVTLDSLSAAERFLHAAYAKFAGRFSCQATIIEAQEWVDYMVRPESRYTMLASAPGFGHTLMFTIVEKTHDHSRGIYYEGWQSADAGRPRASELPGGREARALGMRLVPKLR